MRRFFSGCKSHPAIAPSGSNRSNHGGDETAEAFGIACHELVSLDYRCGSRLYENADAETFRAKIESGTWLRWIIVAAKANFLIQYFVSVTKKN